MFFPSLVEPLATKGHCCVSAGWEPVPMQVDMDLWVFPGSMNTCVCICMSGACENVCSLCLLPVRECIGLFPGEEFSGKLDLGISWSWNPAILCVLKSALAPVFAYLSPSPHPTPHRVSLARDWLSPVTWARPHLRVSVPLALLQPL